MDWSDVAAGLGVMLPKLAIHTVVLLFGFIAAMGRLVAGLRRLSR